MLYRKRASQAPAANLNRRFSEYFNVNYLFKNKSMSICCALLKHGYENFSLTIIEYCEISELLTKEKYFLAERKLLTPEYNIAQDPTAPMSGRTHSEESKTIMSEAKKPVGWENNLNYGQTLSFGAMKLKQKYHRLRPKGEMLWLEILIKRENQEPKEPG